MPIVPFSSFPRVRVVFLAWFSSFYLYGARGLHRESYVGREGFVGRVRNEVYSVFLCQRSSYRVDGVGVEFVLGGVPRGVGVLLLYFFV